MSVFSAIIWAVMAALSAGIVVAYWYERKMNKEAQEANQTQTDQIYSLQVEIAGLRETLARLDGIAQGRECDAMQRKFLESLQENGHGTVRIGRRQA